MGGRAAEEVFLGQDNVTTGCSGDLRSATSTGYRYIRTFGFEENSSLTSTEKDQLSEIKNFSLDVEVNKLL
jgi:ATP-dependent metalloprotease